MTQLSSLFSGEFPNLWPRASVLLLVPQRNPCQHELGFSVCCQAFSLTRAPFPPGTSGPASQASGASSHQRQFRKSRTHTGCGWCGLPPARPVSGCVGVTVIACSCTVCEAQPCTHTRHIPVTSSGLALLALLTLLLQHALPYVMSMPEAWEGVLALLS